MTAGVSFFCLSLTYAFYFSFLLMVVWGFSSTTVVFWQVDSSLNPQQQLIPLPIPTQTLQKHGILLLPSMGYGPLDSAP